MKKNAFAALFAAFVLLAGAKADTLKLQSGQIVNGTFVGADAREIRFVDVNGRPLTYARSEVQGITFSPPPPPPAPAAPPPLPKNVTLLAGTLIPVRLMNSLDTTTTRTGDLFTATLDSNLVLGDIVVARRGATVHGKVTESSNAGRLAGKSELQLALIDIVINGAARPISTSGFQRKGASEGAQTAKKTAGGAGLGAAIGAISGNAGKGAAIGAVSGAGVSMISKGQPIRLPSETLLQFSLSQPTLLPVQH
jgi:hypothetical protein